MNTRLTMRQSQTLGMNQQQQQSLRLLQLSGQELEKTLIDEAERNPFLTIKDARTQRRANGPATSGDWLDSIAAPSMSLTAHLTAQADLLPSTDRAVAYALIGFIDDTGYLTEPPAQLADRLGLSHDAVLDMLHVVQSFEPTGVGARKLAECLLLQAVEAGEADDAMRALLDNLPLLAEGRLGKLARLCGVDDAALGELIRVLRCYDPKPGLVFSPADNGWLNPDIIVRASPQGWRIDLASGALPTVTVVKDATAVAAKCRNADDKNWLSNCANDARALVKAVAHRQRTLLSVATAILEHQQAFLNEGVAALRPLTMREIADELSVHESTVSRAVAGKSLSCPRGTFELRFFFASGVVQQDGEAASAATIKSLIKALIATETSAAILSDDALVERLRAQGYDIARRTVAKYRESVGLGNSSERRRANILRGATGQALRAA
ncbi:hypothetical protein SPAN111604_13620 [Sphingomonas antarctica]|uniref:RNA polymerase factor sigma-54 n=1 Tax=Sphingomonas antarctica TaxID=2040274 RepID=UPI0039ED3FED